MYVLYTAACVLAISTACHSVLEANYTTTLENSLETDTRNESLQECGGVQTTTEGFLISPHFPSSIPPSYTECSWVITGSVHMIVHFKFLTINLPPASPETGQCLGGHVTYGHYDFDGRQVIQHRFCGTEFPPLFVSIGHQAWLTFVSTGTSLMPELYKGMKVHYTIVDTDFLNNQLIVGIVGGLVVPMSCIVAMTCYVRKITQRKRREEREQEYMRMLKYRANDERRKRRRMSKLSHTPGTVHPEQHSEAIRSTNKHPPAKVEAVTKPKSEIVEEDPNNNKIGFSSFLRHIIDSQSTVASPDVMEGSNNTTKWSSTGRTSTSQDQWSFPDGSTGSGRTIVPSSAQRERNDHVFYLTPEGRSFDLTPNSSHLWQGREKFTAPPPEGSVKLTWSAMHDYTMTKNCGLWDDGQFSFPPIDGVGAYTERPSSSLPKRLLTRHAIQANICQSVPDISTVTSGGKNKRTSSSMTELNTRCKNRVILETMC